MRQKVSYTQIFHFSSNCRNTTQNVSTLSPYFCKISKTAIQLRHVCPSVRMEQLGSYWTVFHKKWFLKIFRNTVEKGQISLTLRLLMSYIYMELLVKPEMLTSYIYGPTFGNSETVSFYLLHNVSTLNQCREASCVTFVCKHFAS